MTIVAQRVPNPDIAWGAMSGKECAVEGCSKPAYCKFLCTKHYERLRSTGSPVGLKITARGEMKAWIEAHVDWPVKDECLIWPYKRTIRGYPALGGGLRAHRRMCELVHGAPGGPKIEALHSCDNGHLGCINPNHLRWGTHAENMADMVERGRSRAGASSPRAKLTSADIETIRNSPIGYGMTKRIAEKFDISTGYVTAVRRGYNWGQGR